MLALALRYLNDWAMAAADGAKKTLAEWPPHPDRVFMALAAAYFETDDGDKDAEKAALEWLEQLPPPALSASPAEYRTTVTHYVPVNDPALAGKKKISELARAPAADLGALKGAGLSLVPEFRSRQPRAFPVAVPHRPVVHLIWPDTAAPDDHRLSLEALCRKVTHVGHSASLVQMWLDDSPPAVTLIPQVGVTSRPIRVPSRGRLAYLQARCNREAVIRHADLTHRIGQLKLAVKAAKGGEKKAPRAALAACEDTMSQAFPEGAPVSLRPLPGRWQSYGTPEPNVPAEAPGSVFDPRLVVLALKGSKLTLRSTLNVMDALRNAVMKASPAPLPEWLTGHTPDGRSSTTPHLAFLPLPFVGRRHAQGQLMGVALALPRGLDPRDAARCLDPLLREDDGQSRRIHLYDSRSFDCTAELEQRDTPPLNLLADTWTRPSRYWASVTPVVLDRHFDGRDRWARAAESVKTACEFAGLPRPRDVLLHPVSMFEGVPPSRDFPPLYRKSDGGRRHHAHALIVFDAPVSGPVLIGAGRYRGYGLCRPHDAVEDHV